MVPQKNVFNIEQGQSWITKDGVIAFNNKRDWKNMYHPKD